MQLAFQAILHIASKDGTVKQGQHKASGGCKSCAVLLHFLEYTLLGTHHLLSARLTAQTIKLIQVKRSDLQAFHQLDSPSIFAACLSPHHLRLIMCRVKLQLAMHTPVASPLAA